MILISSFAKHSVVMYIYVSEYSLEVFIKYCICSSILNYSEIYIVILIENNTCHYEQYCSENNKIFRSIIL